MGRNRREKPRGVFLRIREKEDDVRRRHSSDVTPAAKANHMPSWENETW